MIENKDCNVYKKIGYIGIEKINSNYEPTDFFETIYSDALFYY